MKEEKRKHDEEFDDVFSAEEWKRLYGKDTETGVYQNMKLYEIVVKITGKKGQYEVLEGDERYPAGSEGFFQKLESYEIGTQVRVWIKQEGRTISIEKHDYASIQQVPKSYDWLRVSTEFFSPKEFRLFELTTGWLKKRPSVALLATGPSGYGKTSRFQAWADYNNVPCVYVPCHQIRDLGDWTGSEEVRDGSTYYDPNEFARAIQQGNVLIILDEVTRATPALSNVLLSMLDNTRMVKIHNDFVRLGENIFWGVTANVGYQFTGTYELDYALQRRMNAQFRVGPPPVSVEKKILLSKATIDEEQAEKIVALVTQLRSAFPKSYAMNISTAAALNLAWFVESGSTLREAAEYVILSSTPPDDLNTAVNIINRETGETYD